MSAIFVLTSKQMYEAECSAVKRGTTFPLLMEKAGKACSEITDKIYNSKTDKVLVLCGKGKNGGDGFVIARYLSEKGYDVKVLLACGEPIAEDAKVNFGKLPDNVDVLRYNCGTDFSELINGFVLIIDAVFGTGFRGALSPELAELARAVNESGSPVVAVDIPSGLNCDTGEYTEPVFRAEMTIAVSCLKPAHILKKSRKLCGKTVIADIGITDEDFSNVIPPFAYTVSEAKLNERPDDANKGTFGHALCICGSRNMPGACCLAVTSALRTGAGLVTAAFPESAYPAIASKINEALMLPLPETLDGFAAKGAYGKLLPAMKKASAILVGCGLGTHSSTAELLDYIIGNTEAPIVIDADGLNILSRNPEVLKNIKVPVIITPHPGEMSRLCGKSIDRILEDPVSIGTTFANEYNCILVLKSADTRVFFPGSDRYFINKTGNNILSKGGSGDMLSGIIISLLAQGMAPEEAAVNGVFIHGDAADEYSEKHSTRASLPSDIIKSMKNYYKN